MLTLVVRILPPSTCDWPTDGKNNCGSSLEPGVEIAEGTLYVCKKNNDHIILYLHTTEVDINFQSILKTSIGKTLEREFREVEIS